MKEKKILIVVFAVLGFILLVTAATYAWFSYAKEGIKGNTIRSGSIKFHYAEGLQGISLVDAMPMTDAQGKAQTNYFEFDITSKTSNTVEIPYDITVRRSGTGTNMDGVVKVYLTEVTGTGNNEVETPINLLTNQNVVTVSQLTTYTNAAVSIDATKNEKKLTTETVPVGSTNYNAKYRLRMWISSDTEMIEQNTKYYCSGTEVEYDSTAYNNCPAADLTSAIVDEYPYQGKTYTLTVNVYAEGATGSPIAASQIQTTQGKSLQASIDELVGLLN